MHDAILEVFLDVSVAECEVQLQACSESCGVDITENRLNGNVFARVSEPAEKELS